MLIVTIEVIKSEQVEERTYIDEIDSIKSGSIWVLFALFHGSLFKIYFGIFMVQDILMRLNCTEEETYQILHLSDLFLQCSFVIRTYTSVLTLTKVSILH